MKEQAAFGFVTLATIASGVPLGVVLFAIANPPGVLWGSEFGGYETYGVAENMPEIRAGALLPIGLALGCRIVRPVAKDMPLRFADVEIPAGRVVDGLYAEQEAMFAPAAAQAA